MGVSRLRPKPISSSLSNLRGIEGRGHQLARVALPYQSIQHTSFLRQRAMLRAASRSCKAGTSPPVCSTLLLASLTVVLVVASSSAPPVAAVHFGSHPQVFTNSFLVKLRGVQNRQQADDIARRNGFENWGSVNYCHHLYTVHCVFCCF